MTDREQQNDARVGGHPASDGRPTAAINERIPSAWSEWDDGHDYSRTGKHDPNDCRWCLRKVLAKTRQALLYNTPAVDAVDPQAADTGTPSTRVNAPDFHPLMTRTPDEEDR